MIRLKTAKYKLLILLILLVIGFISSCGTKKKATDVKLDQVSQYQESETLKAAKEKEKRETENSDLKLKEETTHFGDTLKGSVPLDSNGVEVESAGIKFKAAAKPVKDKAGNIKGYTLDFNIAAKPTGKTDKSLELNKTAERSEKSNLKTEYAGEKQQSDKTKIRLEEKETKKGFTIPGWVYALALLIALLAIAVFFKPIITFFKSWKI